MIRPNLRKTQRLVAGLLVLMVAAWPNLIFAQEISLNVNSPVTNSPATNSDQPADNSSTPTVDAPLDLNDLNQKISDKQKEVDDLNRQADLYAKNIDIKNSEVLNLLNQLAVLDNEVAKTDIDIKSQETQIEQTNLEIVAVQLQIQDNEKKIADEKIKISGLLQTLNVQDQKSYLEVMLVNNSFSEFFDQLKYLEQVQGQLQQALDGVEALKSQLQAYNAELVNKTNALTALKTNLEGFKTKLENERDAKNELVAETQNSEDRFQNLLSQVKYEKRSVDLQLQDLQDKINTDLQKSRDEGDDLSTPAQLVWPVPYQGISTYFHDPDYVFRLWVGEHSGIDMRTLINGSPAAGVPVRAAANGTVVKIIDNGKFTGNAIYVAHGGDLMTVYLHLSRIDVHEDDFVPVGKVIGMSGGLPGAYGAGLSTGPHLHFEVRLNGIPVNPLEYLPPVPVFVSSANRN